MEIRKLPSEKLRERLENSFFFSFLFCWTDIPDYLQTNVKLSTEGNGVTLGSILVNFLFLSCLSPLLALQLLGRFTCVGDTGTSGN